MKREAVYVGADHNGFKLKEQLKPWLSARGLAIHDVGAPRHLPHDDYPVFAAAVARAVSHGRGTGVLVCGSGHGMAITANRFRGVRAALCATPFSAKMARHDDHANVLVLAGWETTFPQAKKIIAAWLKTAPSRIKRHQRRVAMIERLH